MTRKKFESDRAPVPAGSYSVALEAGGFVFLAGQTPRDRDNVRHGDKPFAFPVRTLTQSGLVGFDIEVDAILLANRPQGG